MGPKLLMTYIVCSTFVWHRRVLPLDPDQIGMSFLQVQQGLSKRCAAEWLFLLATFVSHASLLWEVKTDGQKNDTGANEICWRSPHTAMLLVPPRTKSNWTCCLVRWYCLFIQIGPFLEYLALYSRMHYRPSDRNRLIKNWKKPLHLYYFNIIRGVVLMCMLKSDCL